MYGHTGTYVRGALAFSSEGGGEVAGRVLLRDVTELGES